jgi:hypothetical protein
LRETPPLSSDVWISPSSEREVSEACCCCFSPDMLGGDGWNRITLLTGKKQKETCVSSPYTPTWSGTQDIEKEHG